MYASLAKVKQKKKKKSVKDRIRTCAPRRHPLAFARPLAIAGERVNHSTTLTGDVLEFEIMAYKTQYATSGVYPDAMHTYMHR